MEEAVLAETMALRMRGAAAATVRLTEGGVAGVRLKPVSVAMVAATVMVPATLPVWMRMVVAPLGKTAAVWPAGMVKVRVRPPVANWTEGSLAKTSELKASVSVPVRGRR
ncbi:MAG: hypothetical protein IPJ98_24655 [Bryobacterales bacterium]|nr:hypothetical protein [Bryobacterales bacterium]